MAVEGWCETELSDLGMIVTGKTPDTKNEFFWGGNIPFVTPTDMDGRKYIKKTERFLTEDALNLYRQPIPKGSVMVTCIASIGKMAIADEKCITNQQINSIIPYQNTQSSFLYYSLLSKLSVLENMAAKTAVPIINKTQFSKISLLLPPLSEQKKIAGILESVDDAIAKTEAVIAQTERVKQGLLQQLLTRGIGHTKFKQSPLGEIPESWEVLSMADFCTKVADGTHDTPQRQENGVPLLTSKNLKSYGLDFEDYYCVSIDDAREINKRSKVDQFDILYGMIGTIGNPVIVKSIERDFVIKNVALFKFGGDHLKSNWAHMFLESALMEKVISSKQAGNAQKFLSLKLLRSIEIPVPPKQEMERIITVKTNINAALEGNISKLSKLRSLKAGLMSDLLTGRVRVNVDASPTTQTEVAA